MIANIFLQLLPSINIYSIHCHFILVADRKNLDPLVRSSQTQQDPTNIPKQQDPGREQEVDTQGSLELHLELLKSTKKNVASKKVYWFSH